MSEQTREQAERKRGNTSPAAAHIASATWKARRLFPSGVEALVISRQDSEPPLATQLYRIDANLGWADEIVATDLYEHIALGIAHALDAIYACGVYDEEGRHL